MVLPCPFPDPTPFNNSQQPCNMRKHHDTTQTPSTTLSRPLQPFTAKQPASQYRTVSQNQYVTHFLQAAVPTRRPSISARPAHSHVTGVVFVTVQGSPACPHEVTVEGGLAQPPVDAVVDPAHPLGECCAIAHVRWVAPAAATGGVRKQPVPHRMDGIVLTQAQCPGGWWRQQLTHSLLNARVRLEMYYICVVTTAAAARHQVLAHHNSRQHTVHTSTQLPQAH
jgi:hypothetical protein